KYLIPVVLMCLFSCAVKNDPPNPLTQQTTKSGNPKPSILFVLMNVKNTETMKRAIIRASSYYKQSYVLEFKPIPSTALHPKRKRYVGDSLISYLDHINNGRYVFVAGLTDMDICTNKNGIEDWGIFGQGTINNKGCVTSGKRLSKYVSEKKYEDRLTKVIMHEIGHNHGVNHCVSADPCFMKDGEGKVATVDNEPFEMCLSCKRMAGIQ
ncbi:MAG: hypothetical protein ACKO5C_08290, partial [Ferruginibacter sp.]